MDAQTVSFYETRARDWVAQHRGVSSPAVQVCKIWLRPGCTILDVGSGCGRDMAALQQEGFEVHGLEPAAALIAEAEAAFPSLRGRIIRGSLPDDLPAGTQKVVPLIDGPAAVRSRQCAPTAAAAVRPGNRFCLHRETG